MVVSAAIAPAGAARLSSTAQHSSARRAGREQRESVRARSWSFITVLIQRREITEGEYPAGYLDQHAGGEIERRRRCLVDLADASQRIEHGRVGLPVATAAHQLDLFQAIVGQPHIHLQ